METDSSKLRSFNADVCLRTRRQALCVVCTGRSWLLLQMSTGSLKLRSLKADFCFCAQRSTWCGRMARVRHRRTVRQDEHGGWMAPNGG